ncbi:MAG TPA: hypothetical protein VFY85_13650, partial [Gemmatimonadaceae bacterium]|nr:hypothetical protein [Gemmatimonadaceae bacterium]
HACYVPLTGTVYRIKEDGLRTACSSTSHIEFQWTDGEGALRPTGAAAGDLLQFDGTQWKPVSAASLGGAGGVTGYEVTTLTATNSYSTPQLVILSQYTALCNGSLFQYCTQVTYLYRTIAPASTLTLSCAAGKKAFGVFSAADVSSDIIASGQVSASLPQRQRNGPTVFVELSPGAVLSPSTLPNPSPGLPSTTPDNFQVKAICANAS